MSDIANRSNVENIPTEIMPLVDEFLVVLKAALGDDLLALFLAGSIPRGNFAAQVSDVDFYAVVKQDSLKRSKSSTKHVTQELEVKWKTEDVVSLDCSVVGLDDLLVKDRNRTGFILATDSIQIHGEALDLSFCVPNDPFTLANTLNHKAKKRLSKIQQRFNEGTTNPKDINRLKKISLRCAYGIALIRGAEYTPVHNKYVDMIEKYAPEFHNDVELILDASRVNVQTLSHADTILNKAQELGINFY